MLSHITLQNFRSYPKAEFTFDHATTFIVGPNTAGKSNLIEAIFLLSTGKSFRADKEIELISFGKDLARLKAKTSEVELEVMVTTGTIQGASAPLKKFLVNGVSKRRMDFVGNLPSVLFSPLDVEILIGSPSHRRNFLDDILEQTDREYRLAMGEYVKGIRQRNALLEIAREKGVRNEKQFEYWDSIIITSGTTITKKRDNLIEFFNAGQKDIFDCVVFYDKSLISKERLLQYKDAEVGAGVTLVGPHRDDFSVHMYDNTRGNTHDIKLFGSRGQQRLAILQLKLLELTFMEKALGKRPLFLLDDIFSELDDSHIKLVKEMIGLQQTIITTTHKEFVSTKIKDADIIELQKYD